MPPTWNWAGFEALLNLASGRLFRGNDATTWRIHRSVIDREGRCYQLAWGDGGQIVAGTLSLAMVRGGVEAARGGQIRL